MIPIESDSALAARLPWIKRHKVKMLLISAALIVCLSPVSLFELLDSFVYLFLEAWLTPSAWEKALAICPLLVVSGFMCALLKWQLPISWLKAGVVALSIVAGCGALLVYLVLQVPC